MEIKDFSTFVAENEKNEIKQIFHEICEDVINSYYNEYEIDEGLLTKLQNAISDWLEKNIKAPLRKPKEFINDIKRNIQNVKSEIQADVDLVKSKLRPKNKQQVDAAKNSIRDRYCYDDLPTKYQEEVDDMIDVSFE